MQAVLILAHKNIDQVIELCKKLSPCFNLYLHIDKKCKVSSDQHKALDHLDAKYISTYDVKWGGGKCCFSCDCANEISFT